MPRNKNDVAAERERFNFTLQQNERDRIVSQWINAQPNASEAVKALIYAVATGNAGLSGVAITLPHSNAIQQNDPNDPRAIALMSALDL